MSLEELIGELTFIKRVNTTDIIKGYTISNNICIRPNKTLYIAKSNGTTILNAKYMLSEPSYIFEDINKAELHLKYFNIYEENLNITCVKYIDLLDGTRVTFVQDEYGNIGYSICNPNDQFVKKVGKELAENRLISIILEESPRDEFKYRSKLTYEYCGYLLFSLYLRKELPKYILENIDLFKCKCAWLMGGVYVK